MSRDPFDHPFFGSSRRLRSRSTPALIGAGLGALFLMLMSLVLTVAVWGGIIFAALWSLNHFNVI